MTKVPNFGFSSFLKLVCQNPKPQKRTIRDRHKPSEGGYDYHKSLRHRIQQCAFEGLSEVQAIASTEQIKKTTERTSAKRGLERFFKWRSDYPGSIEACEGLTFSSPGGFFRIIFQPDFLVELGGRRTAVHVWNTKQQLSKGLVLGALSLVATRFPPKDRPDDFAVLSLQDNTLYRWSDATRGHNSIGENLLTMLDTQCDLARRELGLPNLKRPDEPRPTP